MKRSAVTFPVGDDVPTTPAVLRIKACQRQGGARHHGVARRQGCWYKQRFVHRLDCREIHDLKTKPGAFGRLDQSTLLEKVDTRVSEGCHPIKEPCPCWKGYTSATHGQLQVRMCWQRCGLKLILFTRCLECALTLHIWSSTVTSWKTYRRIHV